MTIDASGTASRRKFILLSASLPIVSACQMKESTEPNSSLEELKKILDLPNWVAGAKWEIVTLPERNNDSVPGPTDYVSLVALLTPALAGKTNLGNIPTSAPPRSIPSEFIRSWLPPSSKSALTSFKGNDAGFHNVMPWVRQHAKGAWGKATEDGVLVYVDYVSPE